MFRVGAHTLLYKIKKPRPKKVKRSAVVTHSWSQNLGLITPSTELFSCTLYL